MPAWETPRKSGTTVAVSGAGEIPMTLMLIVTWLVFGFIVGLLARAVYPGAQSMGLLATAGLGIAGSFVGGLLANLIWGGQVFAVQASGFIGSFVGALVVLALLGLANRPSHA
jgi:uncharacterized membrane protein YeaQ/YmgE (transglycosylase-associated protein family)